MAGAEVVERKAPRFPKVAPVWPELYCKWLIENYSYMDADKLFGKGQAFPLDLPEVYIPLYGSDPEKNRETSFLQDKGKEDREEAFLREQKKPVNIETLIEKNVTLLVSGHAGSGKTTLLKHVACALVENGDDGCRISELEDFLPVLIYLKDLNGYFSGRESAGQDMDDLLSWYIREKMGSILSISTVNDFIEGGKVLFLLDGFDELRPKYRDRVVSLFADLPLKNGGNKIVLTSRPHGIEGAAVNRFGDKRTDILSLNREQVEEFIRNWFAYLYRSRRGIGRKNAEAMISEIEIHPAISDLIDNPLMLTAICILYYDGKELPGQRAELYKKFIDNLLYRRFADSERVHDYLKTLAFRMHQEQIRNAERSFAVDILKSVCKQEPGELEKDYNRRVDQLFSDIEPKCGLLKFENGQYSFWHLTFQEFFTAVYIVDNNSDYVKAIETYWGNDWYSEVIELYIGYLSIEHKRTANNIVDSIVDNDDHDPFGKWRLAAHALIDIHKDRGYEKVLEKAQERMQAIIRNTDDPATLMDAGETLGWLDDPRDLKEFIKIDGGEYDLEDFGKTCLQTFEIGKYPVTNRWFEEFIKDKGYDNKDYWSPEGRKWLDYTGNKRPEYWFEREWNRPSAPVVGVSWYEAYAFTRWLTAVGKEGYTYRLLTEGEWQAAATGFKKRAYPWGDTWENKRCNNIELGFNRTTTAGIFRKGDTPEGVADLSGNVREWTSTQYGTKSDLEDFKFDERLMELVLEGYEKKRSEIVEILVKHHHKYPVLRGGSWNSHDGNCRCASRDHVFPVGRYSFVGFRCART